jgi:hypothetical protein
VFCISQPRKGAWPRGAALRGFTPSTINRFLRPTPAEQSAFKKKLDRKFRPIPAIVAKAAQARAKISQALISIDLF